MGLEYCMRLWRRNARGEVKIMFNLSEFTPFTFSFLVTWLSYKSVSTCTIFLHFVVTCILFFTCSACYLIVKNHKPLHLFLGVCLDESSPKCHGSMELQHVRSANNKTLHQWKVCGIQNKGLDWCTQSSHKWSMTELLTEEFLKNIVRRP
jgi:hypothetical protein